MQNIMIQGWTNFKAICITNKNLNCQYAETSASYDLYGPDSGAIMWQTSILKDGGADQTDFETNYKSLFNSAIGQRAYPFSTPDMQFAGLGFSTTFPKGVMTPKTTDYFFKLANGFYLNGGEYWTSGTTAGDILQVDVVDHDNLLGNGIDYVLVSPAYMTAWNILPMDNARNLFQTVYAAKPPAGMYLRFRYTVNSLTIDVKFYCNLFLHKPI